MRSDLSVEAKQTFQVVALLATILVVGIHYKSDVPDFPSAATASWNQLSQEFLFGGIARVAVPLFAFAAGLFYFRSDDGTLATFHKKLRQRTRSLLIPYFIVGSVALVSWLIVRSAEGKPVHLTAAEFLTSWLLHPPAEQLWFLRDLMVLVLIAPLIRRLTGGRIVKYTFVAAITILWAFHVQVFPDVAGWRLLHMETLLFFVLGCLAVSQTDWIETVGRAPWTTVFGVCLVWVDLIILRVILRANFDLWYAMDYGFNDLLLHQISILVGCFAMFMIAWRIRFAFVIRLSGASFFVYLVHEFPLRALAERFSDRFLEHDTSCWIVTPIVLVSCFGSAILLNRICPSLVTLLTGGRTPTTASNKALSDSAQLGLTRHGLTGDETNLPRRSPSLSESVGTSVTVS